MEEYTIKQKHNKEIYLSKLYLKNRDKNNNEKKKKNHNKNHKKINEIFMIKIFFFVSGA